MKIECSSPSWLRTVFGLLPPASLRTMMLSTIARSTPSIGRLAKPGELQAGVVPDGCSGQRECERRRVLRRGGIAAALDRLRALSDGAPPIDVG